MPDFSEILDNIRASTRAAVLANDREKVLRDTQVFGEAISDLMALAHARLLIDPAAMAAAAIAAGLRLIKEVGTQMPETMPTARAMSHHMVAEFLGEPGDPAMANSAPQLRAELVQLAMALRESALPESDPVRQRAEQMVRGL